jgi:hypothetical protein
MHQSKESFKKSALKDRLEAIEKSLSNNKRLRASYVLIRK